MQAFELISRQGAVASYLRFNFAHEDFRSWFARLRQTDFDYAFKWRPWWAEG
jgi:hypothetical protein